MSEEIEPADEPVAAPTDPARLLIERLRGRPVARSRRTGDAPRRTRRVVSPDEQVWSPARPGDRDPTALAASVDDLVDREGWRRTLDEVSLAPRWPAIVGAAVAEHTRPESLVGGELVVRAASTAWATQIRLMGRTLVARIAAEVGDGVVTHVRVIGPTGPDWRHGPLRVRGRGPRDTYG
jgi:predicted nucleic acid-binding Zn ribbon protein